MCQEGVERSGSGAGQWSASLPESPACSPGRRRQRVGALRACQGAGGRSLNPIRAPLPREGARRGAPGPGVAVRCSLHGPRCSQDPSASGSASLGIPAPQSPPPGPPTRTDVQILAAPRWVPRISSDPQAPSHQIASRNPLRRLEPMRGERDQLAPSLQSASTITRRLGIQWDPRRPPVPDPLLGSTPKSSAGWHGIPRLPCAGSSRGIHSQVSGDRFPRLPTGFLPPRRLGARGDPPGPRLFPRQLCQLFSRGLSRAETWRPSPTAASVAPSPAGDRGRTASSHPRGRRATYPGAAAAAGQRRAATCPPPAAPARAARRRAA